MVWLLLFVLPLCLVFDVVGCWFLMALLVCVLGLLGLANLWVWLVYALGGCCIVYLVLVLVCFLTVVGAVGLRIGCVFWVWFLTICCWWLL